MEQACELLNVSLQPQGYSNGTGFDQGPPGRPQRPLQMERGAESLCNQESGDRKMRGAPKPREMAAGGSGAKMWARREGPGETRNQKESVSALSNLEISNTEQEFCW